MRQSERRRPAGLKSPPRTYTGWWGLGLVFLWALSAEAATVTFSATLRGERRSATVELADKNGVAHVPVASVVKQLGGGHTAGQGHVQFDLVGSSARVIIDGTEVDASLSQFELLQPLTISGDAPLMALIDVPPFFKKAFGLEMRQTLAAQPEALPEELPESLPLLSPESEVAVTDLDDPGLLEPITLTDSPKRTVTRRPIGRIILDAGHGGNDFGCEGRNINEKDLTLVLARLVAQSLRTALKKEVLLTRSGDINLPVKARTGFANNHQGDLLVSIHGGASLSSTPHGFAVFSPPSKPATGAGQAGALAWQEEEDYGAQSREIADSVASALAETTQEMNRGLREANCRIFRDLRMPALLVEVGFLTNTAEEALLADQDYQARLAQGIAAGIIRYASGAAPSEVTP